MAKKRLPSLLGRAPRSVRAVKKAAKTFIQRSRGGPTADQKATFHQVDGAGPRHIRRPFLGLTEAEEAEILVQVERFIDGVVHGTR